MKDLIEIERLLLDFKELFENLFYSENCFPQNTNNPTVIRHDETSGLSYDVQMVKEPCIFE